ncbi:glycoprotein-polysaccharide metabolism protein, partial [Salmonella enterica subsp. enterica serovar Thompson]|nr:glycoprotein-polysaccharide metabolism protein [Salmonella enterica subsp. enterica serovar Thompson]
TDPGQSVFCRSCAYPVLILRQPSPLRRGLIHPAIAL